MGKLPKSLTPLELREMQEKAMSESAIQQQVVKELNRLGFLVLVTNAGIRKEAATGLRSRKGAVFATPGVPDLLVRSVFWPQGQYIAIELKTSKGKLSPAQQIIHEKGGSIVCRSLREVLDIPEIAICRN
jgi:hypothetical protein